MTAHLISNLLQWEHTAPGSMIYSQLFFKERKLKVAMKKICILKVFIQNDLPSILLVKSVPIWTATNVQSLVIPRCLPVPVYPSVTLCQLLHEFQVLCCKSLTHHMHFLAHLFVPQKRRNFLPEDVSWYNLSFSGTGHGCSSGQCTKIMRCT